MNRPVLYLRKSVRYVVHNVSAELYSTSLLWFSKPFAIEILDISTRGACIASPRRLTANALYHLKATFQDGNSFDIPGRVLHNNSAQQNRYGFIFATYNDSLGDYLYKIKDSLEFQENEQRLIN